ncbi:sensor histidine kinase [Paenibacillus protaetiae]|uniref:histidine kinase n=1 Tax=Paenibacillus protaetiae TaxID=2509456 RepID=A0A4P6EQL2_9BACL|nr:histidine kinase [Paenibacillus protaetiae]QAY65134.1 sensor histidine kinase [Paenibacillus protaetiae]
MTYRSTKWLILLTPTLTIGLWEYIRHTLLLPYLSMEAGNFMAPVIVLAVTVTVVRKLFAVLEQTRRALEQERIASASHQEREQLSRELHDGISQSMFLLSVKLDQLDRLTLPEGARQTSEQIRATVKHIYEDVRQLIANLRMPKTAPDESWLQSIGQLAADLEQSGTMRIRLDMDMPDKLLTSKAKVELLAIVREAMFNAQKHAHASQLIVRCSPGSQGGWRCSVSDDGVGISEERRHAKGHYGIRMMEDRANAMGWDLSIGNSRNHPPHGTLVTISAERSL